MVALMPGNVRLMLFLSIIHVRVVYRLLKENWLLDIHLRLSQGIKLLKNGRRLLEVVLLWLHIIRFLIDHTNRQSLR
jgi:hypothetical protein